MDHDATGAGGDAYTIRGGRLRAALRLIFILTWTPAMFSLRLAAIPTRIVNPRFERAACRWTGNRWAKAVTKVLGFRLTVQGPVPERPYLIVSNHLSHIDSIIYMHVLNCLFVAMIEISTWPIAGFIVAKMGNLFINRKSMRDALRVGGRLAQLYQQGEGIMIYPEGDTSDGKQVRPFKPALVQPAVDAGWPVHYVTIRHETPEGYPPASWAVCWVGETSFLTSLLRMLRMPWVETTIRFGPEPLHGEERRALAAELHDAVTSQLVPME